MHLGVIQNASTAEKPTGQGAEDDGLFITQQGRETKKRLQGYLKDLHERALEAGTKLITLFDTIRVLQEHLEGGPSGVLPGESSAFHGAVGDLGDLGDHGGQSEKEEGGGAANTDASKPKGRVGKLNLDGEGA